MSFPADLRHDSPPVARHRSPTPEKKESRRAQTPPSPHDRGHPRGGRNPRRDSPEPRGLPRFKQILYPKTYNSSPKLCSTETPATDLKELEVPTVVTEFHPGNLGSLVGIRGILQGGTTTVLLLPEPTLQPEFPQKYRSDLAVVIAGKNPPGTKVGQPRYATEKMKMDVFKIISLTFVSIGK